MGVYEGRGQLGKLLKDLLSRWHDARMSWDDQQARAFGEKYVHAIEMDLRVAVSAMEQMGALIAQIKQDCQ
jgi:hypothetical protein